jgi:hypothetical protein
MTENVTFHNRIEPFDFPLPATEPTPYETPTLEEVLEELHPLPAYSLLMGICEDGMPLILDLTDPTCGSILIADDNESTNFQLLYSLLTSAYQINTPEEVNLHLISPRADDLVELHKQPSFKISFDPTRPECEIVVEEMVNLIHQRQGTLELQPIHILAIDGLDLLLQNLSPEAQRWFYWLQENGPEAGLWTIASMESHQIKESHYSVIDGFPSRILGNIRSPRLARTLSGLGRNRLDDLIPDEQFLVRSESESHKIWMLPTETQDD